MGVIDAAPNALLLADIVKDGDRDIIQSGDLADVGIVVFENSPMDVWHTT